jgi:hypothetical protein
VKLADLARDAASTSTELATYKSREARVPATPAEYGFGLPDGFKLEGEGMDKYQVQLAEDHRLIPKVQDFAKRAGLTPELYKEAVGLAVELQASMWADARESLKAEGDKLGKNAGPRIDNVTRFLNGAIGSKADALTSNIWTTAQVEALEALMDVFRRQGVTPPKEGSRETKETRTGPAWDSRSALEKLRAGRVAQQRATPAARRG